MTKSMLIDAVHPEESRMVIIDDHGTIEDFDFVTTSKPQIKGNIYLAKITRVEPSLQAAFVEYGGGKQGFLPFSEIHPDYYQIPTEDKKRLIAEEEEETAREEEEEEEALQRREARRSEGENNSNGSGSGSGGRRRGRRGRFRNRRDRDRQPRMNEEGADGTIELSPDAVEYHEEQDNAHLSGGEDADNDTHYQAAESARFETRSDVLDDEAPAARDEDADADAAQEENSAPPATFDAPAGEDSVAPAAEESVQDIVAESETDEEERPEDQIETVSSDDMEETRQRRRGASFKRYRIQEVIKRNQIVLVQVIKEERGNKGVSLTTYISLAGRYCVLMPNSPKAGGVSRKIGNGEQRRKLKEVVAELKDSRGLSAIVRTAGLDRTKTEIKRDYEYLVKLWHTIREDTMASVAPALIYEESNLIKRCIRDLYSNDVEQIMVQGEQAYKEAKAFMKLIMPSHAPRVKQHKEREHIFANGIEEQLSSIYESTARLPSGGYIVLQQTEALISIDVNSGRSTTERNVEETAIKTNLEAAREMARQLRLRDLAGLIVVDFIDMYYGKNRRTLEKAVKDALKHDRAKIQMSRISAFGLMEISRQRLRPSIAEASTMTCPHCEGVGTIRSVETVAIQIVRALEREASGGEFATLRVFTNANVVTHLLNEKRHLLDNIEKEYGVRVIIDIDAGLLAGRFRMIKVTHDGKEIHHQESDNSNKRRGRRGKRGGRGGKGRDEGRDERHDHRHSYARDDHADDDADDEDESDEGDESAQSDPEEPSHDHENEEKPRRSGRERGRRGGRGRKRPPLQDREADGDEAEAEDTSETSHADDEGGEKRERGRRGGRGRNRRERTPRTQDNDAEAATASAPRRAAEEPAAPTPAPKPAAVSIHPSQLAAAEVVAVADDASDPNAPKRKGWWNR